MMVEGKGFVAPNPCVVKLSPAEILCAVEEAKRRNELRNYELQATQWKQGLLDGAEVFGCGFVEKPVLPIVIGIVGEYACCSLINRRLKREVCSVDFRLLYRGDGGIDLAPCGMKLNVKTRSKDYEKLLLRRITEDGRVCWFRCEAFVSAQWELGDSIKVIGWEWAQSIISLKNKRVPAMRGNHQNIEVEDRFLKPMCRLIEELRIRG